MGAARRTRDFRRQLSELKFDWAVQDRGMVRGLSAAFSRAVSSLTCYPAARFLVRRGANFALGFDLSADLVSMVPGGESMET